MPTPPPPPPVPGAVVWTDAEPVLDQGQYGTCVGNGGAQWGNTLPIDDHFNEKNARDLYYECTVIDGSPDDPDAPGGGQQGSTVHSLAKALKNRNLLNVYAFASTTDAVTKFIQQSGPVIIGIDWYNDMFNPDAQGLIKPTGGVAGGHCIILNGWHPAGEAFPVEVYEGINSWSDSWGVKGHFFLAVTDFATLLSGNGEALAAVEL
jgi:hypothetical protein